jgi:hypothetical protein
MATWVKIISSNSDASLNSLTVYQTISSSEFVGPLSGTASFSDSASYAYNSTSASYAVSASYALSASHANFSISSSYALSASHSDFSISSSYAYYSTSASYANDADTANIANYAYNAGNADTATSASYSSTSTSASYAVNTTSASYALTASYAPSALSASYALNATTASYSLTSSYADSFTVAGTLTAQKIVVQTITSSTEFVTGSTIFGSQLSNTHQFTGSVSITGSLAVNGVDYINLSSSFDTRILNNSGSISLLSSSFTSFSGSYNTGSFTGSFSGSFTGSLSNLQGTPTHIPFFSASQILANSTMFQVDNGSGQGYSIAINEDGVSTEAPEALYVFQSSTSSYNVISGKGNLNNYLQLNIQNTNNGNSASSDIVATANNGSEFDNYIDMGINSANYSGFLGDPNDSYLYAHSHNFWIGNVNDGYKIYFFNSSSEQPIITLNSNNAEITGSLFGTSSWANNAISSSQASNSVSASYALSSSYSLISTSASYALNGNGIFSGSFSGSFQGNGSGLTNIPASGIVGLNLSQIASGSVTASVSPVTGFRVNANTSIIGSGSSVLNVSGTLGTLLQVNDTISGSLLSVVTGSTNIFQVFSNNLVITSGSNISTGGYTGSLLGTASYASNANTASYASNANTASYILNAVSSSYSSNADLLDGKDSSIFATTGSNTFIGNQTVTGSLFTTGSNTLVGSTTLTGSFNVSGSTTQVGNNTLIGNTTLSGSVAISGSANASANFTLQGHLRLDPGQDPGPNNYTASYLFTSASNTPTGYDLYYRQDGNLIKFKWIEGGLSTGILYGGGISYSGSTIFVKKGSGVINNMNASTGSEINPILTYVTWNDYTASVQNLTSSQNTYLYVDASGSIFQQSTFFNQTQYEQAIPLGRVTHPNYVSITGYGSNVQTTYDSDTQQNDFIRAFGPIKVSGFSILPHTGSLGLGIGSGIAYNLGGFYNQDPNSPSHYESNGFVTASIARAWRSGSGVYLDNNGGNFYTTVDPDYWDDGTGTLNTMNAGDWQIQRVFANPVTGRVVVYYGQTGTYTNLLNALQYLATDPFEEGEFTAKSLVFVGYLVLRGQTNSLTDTTNNRIINAGIFRNIAGGSSGGGAVAQTLNDLSDVIITTPTNYQALVYDSGNWINGTPASASHAVIADTASYVVLAQTSSYVLNAVSSSYSLNSTSASYAINSTSASYASNSTTASYAVNSTSASYAVNSTSASYAINSTSSSYADGAASSSYAANSTSASYASAAANATSASYASTASYADSFTVAGTLTAQTIIVQTITSSIEYVTGSTQFGSQLSNTHQFTGSVSITGSLAVNDSNVILTNQTSSMSVATASYVANAQTASYVLNAQTASYVENAQTASYVLNAVSSSYVLNAVSASYALNTTSASYALNSTNAVNASSGSDFVVTSTLSLKNTLSDVATVASTLVGSNNVFTRATGSYTSAFFKYTVANGANARSGEVMAVWNGSTVQYTDYSTADIGSTRPAVSVSVVIVGGDVQFNIQTNTSGWSIKSLVTFM